MTTKGDPAWLWTTTDDPIRGREMAIVHLIAERRASDSQPRELLDCRIVTPWSGRRTEKEARLAALRQIRTLVVREIQELEGPKQLP